MGYPGEGNNMSNYGMKEPTPEELKLLWEEIVGVSVGFKSLKESIRHNCRHPGLLCLFK